MISPYSGNMVRVSTSNFNFRNSIPILLLVFVSAITAASLDSLENEVISYENQKLGEYKLDIHFSFEAERQRQRQSSTDASTTQWDVQDIQPFNTTYYSESCWAHFSINKLDYLFLCNFANKPAYLLKFDTAGQPSLTEARRFSFVGEASDAKTFQIEGSVYLLVTYFKNEHQNTNTLSKLFKVIEKRGYLDLNPVQDIETYGAKAVRFFQYNHRIFMGIANSQSNKHSRYEVESVIYEWNGVHMDAIAYVTTLDCQTLEFFTIAGDIFVIFVQFQTYDPDKTVGPVIYKFDPNDLHPMTKIQEFDICASKDVQFFSLDGNDYLIVASAEIDQCNTSTTIFWWSVDQFIEFQDLQVKSLQWNSILMPNSEILLIGILPNGPQFFIQNIYGKFIKSRTQGLHEDATRVDIFTISGSSYAALSYSSSDDGTAMYEIILHTVLSPALIKQDELVQCIENLAKKLKNQSEKLLEVINRLKFIFRKSSNTVLKRDVTIKGSMFVDNLLTVNDLVILSSGLFPTQDQVDSNLGILVAALDRLEKDMKDVVFKSQSAIITGIKTFTNQIHGDIVSKIIHSRNGIDGVNINNLYEKTLKYDGDQTFTATQKLLANLDVNSLNLVGKLNGINIKDIMTLYGNQVVEGNITFEVHVVVDKDLTVGQLNYLILDKDVVTVTSNQRINGIKTFSKDLEVTGSIHVGGNINKVDLSQFITSVVTLKDVQTIPATFIFQAPLTINGQVEVRGSISGVDIVKLSARTVDKYRNQVITGAKIFNDVTVKDLFVSGLVNNVDFKDLFTLNTKQEIKGKFTFNTAIFDSVSVNLVNNIDLDKSVVLLDNQEMITGIKTFVSDVKVDGNVDMKDKATINGVDPSELQKFHVTQRSIHQPLYTSSSLTVQDLVTDHPISGVDLNELTKKLWRKSTNQDIPVPIIFQKDVHIQSSVVVGNKINGLDLNNLVHTTGKESIKGKKTFTENSKVTRHLVLAPNATFNGIDLSEFGKKIVRNHGDKTIYGVKTFQNLSVIGDVLVDGKVNGFKISEDLMLTNKDQVVEGKMTLAADTDIKSTLTVDHIVLTGLLNGIKVSSLAEEMVLLDQDAIISGRKSFSHSVDSSNVFITGHLNSLDVEDFFKTAVTLSTDQTIFGHKVFSNDVAFPGDVTADIFNGINLEEYAKTVVLKDVAGTISGQKDYSKSLTVKGNVTVNGLINGLDLSALDALYISISKDQVIKPMLNFDYVDIKSLTMNDDAYLDGVLLKDVLMINKDETVPASMMFKDIAVDNISLKRLLNGWDILKFVSSVVKTTGDETINGFKSFQNLVIDGNLLIDKINGIKLSLLEKEIVFLSTHQTIEGSLTFTTGILASMLVLKGLVNDVDLEFIINDVVTLSSKQEIGAKLFSSGDGLIVKGSLQIKASDINVKTTVNSIDLSEFAKNLLLIDEDQNVAGIKIFDNVVTFSNLEAVEVNGLFIPEDIILTTTNEYISKATVIKNNLNITGDVSVGGLIDGVNLDWLVEHRVSLNENQDLHGTYKFANVIVQDIYFENLVNGISINDLVLNGPHQTINGIKFFKNDLYVFGNISVTGLVNGLDLKALAHEILLRNENTDIVGPTIFESEVEMKSNLKVLGTIDNIDIIQQSELHQRSSKALGSELWQIMSVLSNVDKLIETQVKAAEEKAVLFAYLDPIHTITSESTTRILTSLGDSSIVYTWTTDFHKNCHLSPSCLCYKTVKYFIANNPDYLLQMDDYEFPGRVFPFNVPESNISIWLETTSVSTNFLCRAANAIPEDTYVKTLDGEFLHFSNLISSSFVSDAKVFTIDSILYMVIANYFDKSKETTDINSAVFIYNSNSGNWKIHQEIATHGAISLDVLHRDGDVYLSIANQFDTRKKTFEVNSAIYKWHHNQFELSRSVITKTASDVISLKAGDKAFIIFASEKSAEYPHYNLNVKYRETVDVYLHEDYTKTFEMVQNIHVYGVTCMDTFSIKDDVFLSLLSENQEVLVILQYRGYSRFVEYLKVPSVGIMSMQSYLFKNHVFVILGTDSKISVLKAIVKGQSESLENGDCIDHANRIIPNNTNYSPYGYDPCKTCVCVNGKSENCVTYTCKETKNCLTTEIDGRCCPVCTSTGYIHSVKRRRIGFKL